MSGESSEKRPISVTTHTLHTHTTMAVMYKILHCTTHCTLCPRKNAP